MYFWSKTVNITIEFCIYELCSLGTKFQYQISDGFNIPDKIYPKMIFLV